MLIHGRRAAEHHRSAGGCVAAAEVLIIILAEAGREYPALISHRHTAPEDKEHDDDRAMIHNITRVFFEDQKLLMAMEGMRTYDARPRKAR